MEIPFSLPIQFRTFWVTQRTWSSEQISGVSCILVTKSLSPITWPWDCIRVSTTITGGFSRITPFTADLGMMMVHCLKCLKAKALLDESINYNFRQYHSLKCGYGVSDKKNTYKPFKISIKLQDVPSEDSCVESAGPTTCLVAMAEAISSSYTSKHLGFCLP